MRYVRDGVTCRTYVYLVGHIGWTYIRQVGHMGGTYMKQVAHVSPML